LDRVLGVFAKEPRPGQVKTRLAATIGAEPAARLYDAFLRDLLPRLVAIGATRVLAFAEPSDRAFFRSLCGDHFELEVQSGDDLGARMATFFSIQFARGASRVVLIGSDSPDLPISHIENAFASLDRHDVVLGPCDDGGYYLIGMSRVIPEIFQEIAWSTPSVFDQTKSRLDQLGVRTAVLESWYDIDSLDDLRRLAFAIRSDGRTMTGNWLVRTTAYLTELGYLVKPDTEHDRARNDDLGGCDRQGKMMGPQPQRVPPQV
jgi:rSAM/selenodomain-associated transferase 1